MIVQELSSLGGGLRSTSALVHILDLISTQVWSTLGSVFIKVYLDPQWDSIIFLIPQSYYKQYNLQLQMLGQMPLSFKLLSDVRM